MYYLYGQKKFLLTCTDKYSMMLMKTITREGVNNAKGYTIEG